MTEIERMNYEIGLWKLFLVAGGDPTAGAGSYVVEVWE